MESTQIQTVSDLVAAARQRDVIVLPVALNGCVAEARRVDQLFRAATAAGHKLVRYADPPAPGRPLDLATASAEDLQSAAIGIRFA